MTDQSKERTERAGDPQVSQRISRSYRELGAEEPPRALDDAILAAARREAGARPGSPGRAAPQRWVASLAAAAVLVLAVAVTLHIQIEQPDIAQPAPAAKQPAAPVASALPAAEAEAQAKLRAEQQSTPAARERSEVANAAVKDAAKPMIPKTADLPQRSEPEPFPAREERVMAESRIPTAPQAAAPAPAPPAALSSRADEARVSASGVAGAVAPSAAGTVARQVEDRASREAVAAARAPQLAPAQAMAKRAPVQESVPAETPERELERIADLRRQARHDEADKALAEFRKRYPEFRITEAMLERVERR